VPNSHPDDQPVSWGRFEVTVRSMDERLDALRDQASAQAVLLDHYSGSLAAAEESGRSLSGQFDRLSKQVEERKQRTWTLITILLTGLALPLLLALLTIVFHLRKLPAGRSPRPA
jgi:uncharacterized coiled-coil protein SlyX